MLYIVQVRLIKQQKTNKNTCFQRTNDNNPTTFCKIQQLIQVLYTVNEKCKIQTSVRFIYISHNSDHRCA